MQQHQQQLLYIIVTSLALVRGFRPTPVAFNSLHVPHQRVPTRLLASAGSKVLAAGKHVSQFRSNLNEIRRVLNGGLRVCPEGRNWLQQIKDIIEPSDCAIIILGILAYKPLLKALYQLQEWARRKISKKQEEHHDFEYSLWGYLRRPFRFLAYYLPFLYLVDVVSIVLHALGIDSHLQGDVPRLAATVGASVTAGHFVNNVKDWLLHNQRLLSGGTRDQIRESTVDELTSVAVWALVLSVCLEQMKLQMGFALTSIFAVGGIGSASVVLALRSTFENLVGGLLLKLNDKFRVGEVITIPSSGGKSKGGAEEGQVEEISYITTQIRRDDNSIVAVPNHVFTHGEVINWSRTPFRLLRLSVSLGMDELAILPLVVSGIREALPGCPGIETVERPLVVAATGFKDSKILVDVTCHIATSEDQEAAAMKTQVINTIAGVVDEQRKKVKAAAAK